MARRVASFILAASSTLPPSGAFLRRSGRQVSVTRRRSSSIGVVETDEPKEVITGKKKKNIQFRVDLASLAPAAFEKYVVEVLEAPRYRSAQLREWIFDKGIGQFALMANLPKKLRSTLEEKCTVGGTIAGIAVEQVSQRDGTVKRAYELNDGRLVESVLMPYADGRRTACISSQVGCAMACSFCATGQMGFTRNLTSAEIFEQAARFSRELNAKDERLSNVVFMGMGEPLANYEAVLEASRRINEELGIGARHITISTVGLAPQIERLADELPVTLAVSLHFSDDDARSTVMPINKRFDLERLMTSVRSYQLKTKRRVTFEWAAIAGENDDAETARKLGKLLKRHSIVNAHVNVIPLNPTQGFAGEKANNKNVDQFCAVLDRFGYSATPRVRRGIDIDAGCGQLTTKIGASTTTTAPSNSSSSSSSSSSSVSTAA